jgi:hypothetical protein
LEKEKPMSGFTHIESDGAPIKAWTQGVPIEDSALKQLRNVAALPFIHKHVAVMPDVHWGMGATVGSVIPTVGAIIPAAVGVDIGCGMMAVRTSIRAEHLPDNLFGVRSDIEAAVPHGRTDNGGRNDKGAWQVEPPAVAAEKWAGLKAGYDDVVARHPKAAHPRGFGHLGTLGTGNHFVELCLDEAGDVWVMLHSGSRGVGNRFGTYFIERAKHEMRRWYINLPDQDLAYFAEGSEGFIDYVRAVSWAQKYARANREVMMEQVLVGAAADLPRSRDHAGSGELPPQLRVAGKALRQGRVPHPQGGGLGQGRRAGDHPGFDGRQVVHRARPGKPGLVLHVLARGRTGDEPHRSQAAVHDRRPRGRHRRGRVPQGRRRDRRNADGLQGHRRGHGRPERPGGHRPHAAPGGVRRAKG